MSGQKEYRQQPSLGGQKESRQMIESIMLGAVLVLIGYKIALRVIDWLDGKETEEWKEKIKKEIRDGY